MIKNFLGLKEKKRAVPKPLLERKAKSVPSKRFNDMIAYYTTELKSRIDEVAHLKKENEMLIKTSLKSASRSDENRLVVQKLQEEIRILRQKLTEKNS